MNRMWTGGHGADHVGRSNGKVYLIYKVLIYLESSDVIGNLENSNYI